MKITATPGKTDSFTDVMGIKVGQAHDVGVNTGTTVIIPDNPIPMGVDVRGGGPGTRDTNALDPTCLVEEFHGLVLSGGSVFGLDAAGAVTEALSEKGIGFPFGPRALPVVPSAILFDLKNGGDKNWGAEAPYRRLGLEALNNLSTTVEHGRFGAGHGATAGGVQGGIASASLETEDGLIVSAIVAVNSFGPTVHDVPMEHGTIEMPKLGFVGTNTTIGAVVTNLKLDKAGCTRLAMMAQDGYARAIRPIHTPFDGDTVFAMATGDKEVSKDAMATTMAVAGTLAADCVAKAIEKAVKAA
ncbi:P1 family peptidase [Kordiimonas laminariae]|uniref:P1 family peptidase n=1 Tax=Kordiimonas laminariae TaxID=2917717 RepID=UPI001FF3ACE1|nr:P1 family peptidase [Kordiimonas laminariae]MCK0069345.1 P1 family peptidase [Kordiimonas laminariae]